MKWVFIITSALGIVSALVVAVIIGISVKDEKKAKIRECYDAGGFFVPTKTDSFKGSITYKEFVCINRSVLVQPK